ncbi:hypothetical protein GOODEAATRI_028758 [Goodea atripinnis]|uniref:Uncharacterized protein n=1 Tax=Goodea atripinnis TaxID=208336 RepID=A0ABV0P8M9_9TELE
MTTVQVSQQLIAVRLTANTWSGYVTSSSWFSGATGESAAIQRYSTESRASDKQSQVSCGCKGAFSATVWRVTGSRNRGRLQSSRENSDKDSGVIRTWRPALQPLFLDFFLDFPEAHFLSNKKYSFKERVHTNGGGKSFP